MRYCFRKISPFRHFIVFFSLAFSCFREFSVFQILTLPLSSWINISNLDPLTAEKAAAPPANIKNKGLAEAYNVAQAGFGLENVKEIQANETMDVDSAESEAAEEPEEGVESMDVDEPESEEEKPKKKGASKKRKLSVSDEEAEASEKPTKTPKKAAPKAKTPKTTAKTPKTPKTPANGTTKAAAKPKAGTVKKPAAVKSAKKKAPARNSKAKSAEKIDESDSEGEEASSEVTKEEEKIDPAEFQLKQVKALRGRLQRGFLDKNKPPVANVSSTGGFFYGMTFCV